jgi:hypothetical protein
VRKKRDEELLRMSLPDPEPEAEAAEEMDAAESRWDPWLRALARMELASEARLD